MKKFALISILLLAICSQLVSIPKINVVRTNGTIYIRADMHAFGAAMLLGSIGQLMPSLESIKNQAGRGYEI